MTAQHYSLFDTALGRCALIWSADGIVGFQLPESSEHRTRERVRRCFADAQERPLGPAERTVAGRVAALLDGADDALADVVLDLTGVGDFDRRVYAVTRTIGPGHTLTYGEVAAAVGSPSGAQAVGQSLGRNPIPVLVPCHRVLAAHGAVGGFSAAGGVVTKRTLLAAEHTPGFGEPTLF